MQKVKKLHLGYIGIDYPETAEEVKIEILGLTTAITEAKKRIAVLEQSLCLQELMHESKQKETIEETPNTAESKG